MKREKTLGNGELLTLAQAGLRRSFPAQKLTKLSLWKKKGGHSALGTLQGIAPPSTMDSSVTKNEESNNKGGGLFVLPRVRSALLLDEKKLDESQKTKNKKKSSMLAVSINTICRQKEEEEAAAAAVAAAAATIIDGEPSKRAAAGGAERRRSSLSFEPVREDESPLQQLPQQSSCPAAESPDGLDAGPRYVPKKVGDTDRDEEECVTVLAERLRRALLQKKKTPPAPPAAAAAAPSPPPPTAATTAATATMGADNGNGGVVQGGGGQDDEFQPVVVEHREETETFGGCHRKQDGAAAAHSTFRAATKETSVRTLSLTSCEEDGDDDEHESSPRSRQQEWATATSGGSRRGSTASSSGRASFSRRESWANLSGAGARGRRRSGTLRRRGSITDMIAGAARRLSDSVSNIGNLEAEQTPTPPPWKEEKKEKEGVDPNDPRLLEIAKLRAELDEITLANRARDNHIGQMRMHVSVLTDLKEKEREDELRLTMAVMKSEREERRLRKQINAAPETISFLRRVVEKSAKKVRRMKAAFKKVESARGVDGKGAIPESALKMIAALVRCDPLGESDRKRMEERERREALRPAGRKMRRSAWTMQSASVGSVLCDEEERRRDMNLVGMTLTVSTVGDEADRGGGSRKKDDKKTKRSSPTAAAADKRQISSHDKKKDGGATSGTVAANKNATLKELLRANNNDDAGAATSSSGSGSGSANRNKARRKKPAEASPPGEAPSSRSRRRFGGEEILRSPAFAPTSEPEAVAPSPSPSPSPSATYWSRRLADIRQWHMQQQQQQGQGQQGAGAGAAVEASSSSLEESHPELLADMDACLPGRRR